MKLKRLFLFLIASFALFAVASCNHKEDMEPTYDPGAVVFNVTSLGITDHGIDVVVKHNGGEKDGWNGFLTEDMTTPIDELIRSQAVPVSRKDFHYGKSQTVRLTGLEAEKDYRYIAYGIKDDKTLYGIPGFATFTTAEDFTVVVFNVELAEVTGHEAHFKVTHNGKDSYTWYAFATQDFDSDINDLVSAKAAESLDMLNRGASTDVSLLELASDTDYRYIVFGIKENGAVYGTPAEVTFKTLEDFDGIRFQVEATKVGKKSAEIAVSHDGREDYTWFGFLAEDLETSISRLVESRAEVLTDAEIQTGKNVTIPLSGLETGVTYRYIVSGIKDGEVYGIPGYVEFTTEEHVVTPYEKWLGKWSATGSDGTVMNFEITKKVTDQTYNITGFGEDSPLEAGFDAETGDLQLLYQQAGSNSKWTFYLAGIGTNNYVAYGDNDKGILGIVKLTGDGTATGEGNEYDYSFSDGSTEHYIVSWIGIFGYGQRSDGSTGWVNFTDVTYHYFPSQWVQTESAFDDDEEDEGDDAYSKWLGNWTTQRQTRTFEAGEWKFTGTPTTDTWTIAEKEKGVSYEITGIWGRPAYKVEAIFHAEDGSFTIANGQEPIGTVRFQGMDYSCDVCVFACYLHENGSAYYFTGNFNILTANLSANGTSAELVPGTLTNSSLNMTNAPISAIRMYGHDTQENKYYGYDSMNLQNLPNTLTKATGSNVARQQTKERATAARVASRQEAFTESVQNYQVAMASAVSR